MKMSKMAHFFVFSANASEKSGTVKTNYLRPTERSCLALSQNAGFWVAISKISSLSRFH